MLNWQASSPLSPSSTTTACSQRPAAAISSPRAISSCGSSGSTNRKSLVLINEASSIPPRGKLSHQASRQRAGPSAGRLGQRCWRQQRSSQPTSTTPTSQAPTIAGSSRG